jgi:hypothetical protein
MNTVRTGAVALLVVGPVCGALLACAVTTPIEHNVFQQCGTVRTAVGHVLPQDAAAATAAESCFARAYTTGCQASVLTYTSMGVDTGVTQTFSESRFNGACAVKDTVQGYTANGGGKTFPSQTSACTSVRQQADGLLFTSCGAAGDVLVPAP